MGQAKSFLPIDFDEDYNTLERQGMIGLPRKFPSPSKDGRNGNEEVEGASCEELVVTGIPFNPKRLTGGPLNQSNLHMEVRRCNFVINHEGRFKVLWDWIVLVLVIFTAIQIPYYAAFSAHTDIILNISQKTEIQPILILSLIVDCMFVLDILLNFRTSYIQSSSDIVERHPKKLAIHYLKTWFIIDLLAAIPFDWIMRQRSYGRNTSTLVGLLKSARLLRLFRVARKLDRYSEYGLAVLFLLMCLFTLIAHWLACIWNAISLVEEDNANTWVRRMDEILYPVKNESFEGVRRVQMSQSQRYIASLYFIVSSLTSVGFGNISATTELEQAFSIITMLLGALMYACIFGNMVAIVQRLYSKASTFHNHMNTVREFMKFYKIPEELRQSINNYVRREWAISRGIDAETVLQRFPECIQADLTYELYQNVFHNVKPFRTATVSCMRSLAMKFKTMTLQAGNFALRQGEEVNRLYIVGKGSLEILIDGNLLQYLTRYSTFGYDFHLQYERPKSRANVRAANLVEIHYIHKKDFKDIMQCYPKFAETFNESYRHGFDLNDPTEEGCQVQDTKRKDEKIHVAAMARQALGMPILHKWNKIHKQNKTASNNKDKISNKKSSIEEGCVDPKKYSNGSVKLAPIANGEVFNIDLNAETAQSSTSFSSKESSLVFDKSYDMFNHRLSALESKVDYLSQTFDTKLTSILTLLHDIKNDDKESNCKKIKTIVDKNAS